MSQILLCLDKFRGSATAQQACSALASGLRAARPELDVIERPVADGGEGTVDALVLAATNGAPRSSPVRSVHR
jgi:glycerate kinase